jgi:hypothetical protein
MTKRSIIFAAISILWGFACGAGPKATASVSPVFQSCTQLAGSLQVNPAVKSVSSSIVPTTPGVGSQLHCRVKLLYGENPQQNINIVVALPLNAADGGTSGVEDTWNGRTQSLGGGGCMGNLLELSLGAAELNAGYVISGNDLGHRGGDCNPGLNADGSYNWQFIQDFIRNGIKQQVIWTKTISRMYYGVASKYDYWNGGSTGGRQGYLLAQELGEELDGVLAYVPAIYWIRFQTAQMWGQIAMRELVGGPIKPEKLEQARISAVVACDELDGVRDGIIDDPRTCSFSAEANRCSARTAPPENCLSADEAAAIDKIWDGPRNRKGYRIWYGLDRGTDFSVLNGPEAFALGVTTLRWAERDRDFDWRSLSLNGYPAVAQHGSRNIADITDTSGSLDAFRAHGGKLLTWVGSNDQAIFPRGAIHYYRQMAARYSETGRPDFENVGRFLRLFMAPGVDHSGLDASGPIPLDPFAALVRWVEAGIAPEALMASGGSAAKAGSRTRPLCLYPKRAIYIGSGSSDDANNFYCGGNLETPEIVCDDVLVKYKDEERGNLDFVGTGVDPKACSRHT